MKLNTKNRDAAIHADHIKYGPLNVDEPGDYWKDIAEYWDTTEEAAKKSNCGNCVAFDISPRMKDCMPGETSDDDGELGYCWMHHFKCHSARSCYTWAKGGPIDEDSVSYEWQDKNEFHKRINMSSIIDQMIDEELKIRQHPNKDMIVSAIGNPDFLVTFSDVNKVGINPGTKFNTPAGIYGWHFTQDTIDGAKKNKLFASGRDYGHLMKIKDGAKVLWLGDDGKTGGVPSQEEINSAIAKKYPAFTKDTFPVYEIPDTSKPMGSGAPPKLMMANNKDPYKKNDRVSFVSPQEWLEDPKHVETLSKVSQREYGGSSESEKLYDYIQAAAKALEMATDKKITLISNGILRALGYDAVIDTNGAGIIHKAEKEQGFFTHRGALDHVATIMNKKYAFRESTLYRLLREPGVPIDKKAAALKNLLGTGPKIAPGADPQFDPEFDRTDIFDTLDYITADQSQSAYSLR